MTNPAPATIENVEQIQTFMQNIRQDINELQQALHDTISFIATLSDDIQDALDQTLNIRQHLRYGTPLATPQQLQQDAETYIQQWRENQTPNLDE